MVETGPTAPALGACRSIRTREALIGRRAAPRRDAASCPRRCRARCPTRRSRRAAAASIPAARTRSTAAARRSRCCSRSRAEPHRGVLAADRARDRRRRPARAGPASTSSTHESVDKLGVPRPSSTEDHMKRFRTGRGARAALVVARGVSRRPRSRTARRTTPSAPTGRSSSTARSRSRPPTRSGRSSRPHRSSTAAIYDTLFTYKGGDLAHPRAAARAVVEGDRGREDVRLQAAQERPLRRRHAADVGRRRLLVPAA